MTFTRLFPAQAMYLILVSSAYPPLPTFVVNEWPPQQEISEFKVTAQQKLSPQHIDDIYEEASLRNVNMML